MPADEIFPDVFEAIRYCEKSHCILNLKDKGSGYLKRIRDFKALNMPDGSIGVFPANMSLQFYRGEDDDYETCFPNIYRLKSKEEREARERNESDIIIDLLKIIEFELILQDFPQVYYAQKDYCKVDFKALAQHYGLNTDYLDLTCDIVAAAFFSTHYYDDEWKIRNDGIGCIRKYVSLDHLLKQSEDRFKMIGLQPFRRPGEQSAFAIYLEKGDDFAKMSYKCLFYQDPIMNKKIHDAIYQNGSNMLFPSEEISDVADIIKNSNSISMDAVDKYCRLYSMSKESIVELLKEKHIDMINGLQYSLSRQQRRRLEREYKDKPYGANVNIRIFGRLCGGR